MGGPGIWFWPVVIVVLAGLAALLFVQVKRNGFSLQTGLLIASVVLGLAALFAPIPTLQFYRFEILGVLVLAWAGYFIWRASQDGWGSPPTMSQQERVLTAFKASNPGNQMMAAIPATVIENPSSPQSRRVVRGMLILTAQSVQVHGPRVAKPLQIPASDIAAMPVVASQEREAPGAPSVIVASKSGAFEWVAISETGQEGAELIAKWGERAYGR